MSNIPPLPNNLKEKLSVEILPQQAFGWDRTRWGPVARDIPEAESILGDLPEQLDRAAVRAVVTDNLSHDRVLGALIPVLIWGGPGGYGPFRGRAILTGNRTRGNLSLPVDDAIRTRLMAAAEAVQRDGVVEAFRLMNNEGKIKYLGSAFFTKWLSFSSMADSVDGPEVAPILDKRISDWIRTHTSGENQVILSRASTTSYQRYLDLLDAWGKPNGRTRAQVELAIFELSRSLAAGRWQSKG